MPKVGEGKEAAKFPYTKEGVEAAEDFAQKTKQEVSYPTTDARGMRETYQLGGRIPGQPGFGLRPEMRPPLPGTAAGIYEEGGAVDKYYKKGGKTTESPGNIWEQNKAKREKIAKANKKAASDARERREARRADRKARRAERKGKDTKVKVTGEEKRNIKKIKKLEDKGVKVTTTAKTEDEKKELVPTGKIKKKDVSEVLVTKGGAYPTYKKESKSAKSFRSAFAEAKGEDFTWQGRKYSGKTKEKPKPKPKPKPDTTSPSIGVGAQYKGKTFTAPDSPEKFDRFRETETAVPYADTHDKYPWEGEKGGKVPKYKKIAKEVALGFIPGYNVAKGVGRVIRKKGMKNISKAIKAGGMQGGVRKVRPLPAKPQPKGPAKVSPLPAPKKKSKDMKPMKWSKPRLQKK